MPSCFHYERIGERLWDFLIKKNAQFAANPLVY